MKLVFVSTYPPRRCGLATFTEDLRTALRAANPGWNVTVAAVDRDGHRYGREVLTVVSQDDAEGYRRAARTIATAGTDLVVIQHEYGIFGGPDGSHVLEFADELRLRGVPYAVTLHTVLAQPGRGQEAALAALCGGATRITVFTRDARNLAAETGIADLERVVVVPHGPPQVLREPVPRQAIRPAVAHALASLGVSRVITTFGLIGPGKGLENAIAALHAVVERHFDVRYMIAGVTHPEVLRHTGESYRSRLEALASALGVADHVLFLDTFLTESELAALLQRTDLFLAPYRSPDQVSSGALTFAVAAGCPVLSTAFRYAVEMLASRGGAAPGVLVPCDDTEALANAVADLLADPETLHALRGAATALGATLTWPVVATRFAEVFADAATAATTKIATAGQPPWARLCLDHLDRLTDEIGILQFATGSTPDPDSGYCVDDVARLAIVAIDLATIVPAGDPLPRRWLATALRFLEAALASTGMHNKLGYDGTWRDAPHPGDHVGRALWALGRAAGALTDGRDRARRLLGLALPLLGRTESLHTVAYAILGLTHSGDRSPATHAALTSAADRLHAAVHGQPQQLWFEPQLTYDNARLPHALLAAGAELNDGNMVSRGLSTLDWYLEQVGLSVTGPAILRCVGNGWRGIDAAGPTAGEGDEQPLDAAAVVEALACAWQVTGEHRYARLAQRSFAWFHGANRAGVPVYDPITGGCRDGLSATAANENHGAESTLAYHQAMLALARVDLLATSRPEAPITTDTDCRARSRALRHQWSGPRPLRASAAREHPKPAGPAKEVGVAAEQRADKWQTRPAAIRVPATNAER